MLDILGQRAQHALDIVPLLEAEMLIERLVHLLPGQSHPHSPHRIEMESP